ncbi:3-deoxy-7-phosphoheptulonate synthase [Dichomitus squalens LYAD-421 SS1]|uniref:3-deoxy-7-phosphoheptulonate synthase n=1 Tax=Dichomitus squalens (strain LYAD-421) TaxID=732165 RepID=UPI0004410CC9|nr:3-deoxy-7-phosphoheptulonate synthase [Dichomitus squalens LYAD-421 SS1]EJF63381.1 3-deoxy-7-phosphoheptulonate synthase [Dichomitus squalens LYAD-421 SS1]
MSITVRDALAQLDDRRVKNIRPLIPPAILQEDLPLTLGAAETVLDGRKHTENILHSRDDRLLVVVGPCSVHNVESAKEYARLLRDYAETAKDDLHIIMRVYFEKPRTTVGWKGLINDPDMNGSFQINKGLRIARSLLLDIAKMGLPAGCEFLDTISPQYTADLVSWGAIGARTTESQVHRELTSALSMPTGFKNSTDGTVGIAIDACRAASRPHVFLSVGKGGLSSIVETEGNPDVHVILRGGNNGPNFAAEFVRSCGEKLAKAGFAQKIMIDCSHGNSQKQHIKQIEVAEDIARQLESSDTSSMIMGVMIESNLVEGRQDIPVGGSAGLKYGQSVTDACISWEQTVPVLERLREGVRARRARVRKGARGDVKLNGVNGSNGVNGTHAVNGANGVNGSA